jgi:hypothetical protein
MRTTRYLAALSVVAACSSDTPLPTLSATASSYSLSVSPSTVNVLQGGTSQATISIARADGFESSVALSVSGAPQGLTATIAPTSTANDAATLSLTAASSLAAGTLSLTITGVVSGLANQRATVNVVVLRNASTKIVGLHSR